MRLACALDLSVGLFGVGWCPLSGALPRLPRPVILTSCASKFKLLRTTFFIFLSVRTFFIFFPHLGVRAALLAFKNNGNCSFRGWPGVFWTYRYSVPEELCHWSVFVFSRWTVFSRPCLPRSQRIYISCNPRHKQGRTLTALSLFGLDPGSATAAAVLALGRGYSLVL